MKERIGAPSPDIKPWPFEHKELLLAKRQHLWVDSVTKRDLVISHLTFSRAQPASKGPEWSVAIAHTDVNSVVHVCCEFQPFQNHLGLQLLVRLSEKQVSSPRAQLTPRPIYYILLDSGLGPDTKKVVAPSSNGHKIKFLERQGS
jgi:hypothetical protein